MVMFIMGVLVGILGALIGLHLYGLYLDKEHKDRKRRIIADMMINQNRAVS
jgi:hypothetical protein